MAFQHARLPGELRPVEGILRIDELDVFRQTLDTRTPGGSLIVDSVLHRVGIVEIDGHRFAYPSAKSGWLVASKKVAGRKTRFAVTVPMEPVTLENGLQVRIPVGQPKKVVGLYLDAGRHLPLAQFRKLLLERVFVIAQGKLAPAQSARRR